MSAPLVMVAFMRNPVLVGLMTIAAPVMAHAASFDLVGDFGSSVFAYGAGNYDSASPMFTAFPFTYGNCFGVATMTCQTSGSPGDVSGVSNLPGVGMTTAAGSFLTVDISPDQLWAHPANGGGTSDAAVRFTAPSAGVYRLTGLFSRIDQTTSGSGDAGNNGVDVSIFATIGGITSRIFQSNGLLGAGIMQGTTVNYGQDIALGANDTLSYVVGNNGVFYNDSTGLSGTIASVRRPSLGAVPEPASWAMMVGGFGMLGFGMRQARRRSSLA